MTISGMPSTRSGPRARVGRAPPTTARVGIPTTSSAAAPNWRIASNGSCRPVRPSTELPAARSRSGSTSSIVQSDCADFGASGISSRKLLGRSRATRVTWSNSRGVAAVRFATIRTRELVRPPPLPPLAVAMQLRADLRADVATSQGPLLQSRACDRVTDRLSTAPLQAEPPRTLGRGEGCSQQRPPPVPKVPTS